MKIILSRLIPGLVLSRFGDKISAARIDGKDVE